MDKDAYFFKHDSNAKDDPKCVMLIEQMGLEGYGIYWILVETLRDQPEYKYPLKLIPALARRYNTTAEKIKVVVFNYELFTISNEEFFFSQSLMRRMEHWDYKRYMASIAGKKSAAKRLQLKAPSTDVERTLNNGSTNNIREDNIIEDNIISLSDEAQKLLDKNLREIDEKSFEFSLNGLNPELRLDVENRLKEGTEKDLILKAISIACSKANGNKSSKCSYAIRILQSWATEGIKTIIQWNEKFNSKTSEKPFKSTSTPQRGNFDQRQHSDDYFEKLYKEV